MKAGGRSELDLPDARQYTSFWWAGQAQPDGWGFVVSPRQGQTLRQRLAKGKALRVRAKIASRVLQRQFRGRRRLHSRQRRVGSGGNAAGQPPVPPAAGRARQRLGRSRADRDRRNARPADPRRRSARAPPRHPLHLAAGDDRHLRLAGGASRPDVRRRRGRSLDRRTESRHGGRRSGARPAAPGNWSICRRRARPSPITCLPGCESLSWAASATPRRAASAPGLTITSWPIRPSASRRRC